MLQGTFDPSSYSFDSVALNGVAVWIIQHVKKSNWRIFDSINEGTPVRILSATAASLTAAGMSVNWANAADGGTLTISGITVVSVASFCWLIFKNVLFQHLIYKGTYGAGHNGAGLEVK